MIHDLLLSGSLSELVICLDNSNIQRCFFLNRKLHKRATTSFMIPATYDSTTKRLRIEPLKLESPARRRVLLFSANSHNESDCEVFSSLVETLDMNVILLLNTHANAGKWFSLASKSQHRVEVYFSDFPSDTETILHNAIQSMQDFVIDPIVCDSHEGQICSANV